MNTDLGLKQDLPRRVLGIDPGFGTVGFGLVEQLSRAGMDYNYLDSGSITTDPGLDFTLRLGEIYEDMLILLDNLKPDLVVIEKLYFATNVSTAMQVAEARGVILLACQQKALPIFEYTPLQIKSTLTGDGKAKKSQVKQMVLKVLGLDNIPGPDDVLDALAVAMTHS